MTQRRPSWRGARRRVLGRDVQVLSLKGDIDQGRHPDRRDARGPSETRQRVFEGSNHQEYQVQHFSWAVEDALFVALMTAKEATVYRWSRVCHCARLLSLTTKRTGGTLAELSDGSEAGQRGRGVQVHVSPAC